MKNHGYPASAKASSSSSSQIISFERFASSTAGTTPSPEKYPRDDNVDRSVRPKDEPGLNGYTMVFQSSYESDNCAAKHGQGVKRSANGSTATTRSPLHAQDHVLAERKRREKLSQRFIALSAVVPGLKKVQKLKNIC